MNRQFIVVALAISGKGNKIFKSGSTVREDQLNYPADQLIKEGYIMELESSKVDETKDLDSNETPVLFSVQLNDETIDVRSNKDLTKKQIVQLLTEMEVEFDRTKSEKVLFDQLAELKK